MMLITIYCSGGLPSTYLKQTDKYNQVNPFVPFNPNATGDTRQFTSLGNTETSPLKGGSFI
jgi:hypothetical protein